MHTSANRILWLFITSLILVVANVQADVLKDIQKRGTLRVGVSLFEPWTIRDEAGGLFGFEIDVANKLAEDIGVKPEYKIYLWEDIIPAVMKGEIDIIAGGMAITPERALKINFSKPYADSGISLVTNTGHQTTGRTESEIHNHRGGFQDSGQRAGDAPVQQEHHQGI